MPHRGPAKVEKCRRPRRRQRAATSPCPKRRWMRPLRRSPTGGRGGMDDEIGTLNHVSPADIVAAAKLIKRGQAFALGIPLGQSGPQRGLFGKRWNPIHTMLATGTDALAGRQEHLLYADDAIN